MENEIISKYTKSIMSEMKAGNKERANVFKLIKTKMMEFVTRSDKPVLDTKAEIASPINLPSSLFSSAADRV